MTLDIDLELDSLHSLAGLAERYGSRRLAKYLDKIETGFLESGDREDKMITTAEHTVVVPGGLLELYSMVEEYLYTSEAVLMITVDINPKGRGLLSTLYNHGRKSLAHWKEAISAYHCADICAKRRLTTEVLDHCDLFEYGWWISVLSKRARFTEDMIDFLRKRAPQIERLITKKTITEVIASREDDESWDRAASFDLDVPIYMIPLLVEDGTLESFTPTQLSASLAWLRLSEAIIRYLVFSE